MSLTSPKGLQLNDGTLVLYKNVREFSPTVLGPGYHQSGDGNLADAAGNYPMSIYGTAWVANGPLGAAGALATTPQFARGFSSVLSGYLISPTTIDQAYNDAIRQSFTQQFLINLQWSHTAGRCIYGGNNTAATGAANDWLARILILSDGRLNAYWESNNTDYNVYTPSTAITPGVWSVVTVSWQVDSGGYAITFDVHELQGASVVHAVNDAHSTYGAIPLSTSGVGDGNIMYGRGSNAIASTDNPYIGAIAFGRIYKGLLSSDDIDDQAEELLTTGTLASVAVTNDLHRHEFNEPPDMVDEGPFGLHGWIGNMISDYDDGERHLDLVGSGGRPRRGNGTAESSSGSIIPHTMMDYAINAEFGCTRMAGLFNDTDFDIPEYTIQFIGLIGAGSAVNVATFYADGESLSTNYLFKFWVDVAGGSIQFFGEYGNGTNCTISNVVAYGAMGTDITEQVALFTFRVGPKPGSPSVMHARMSINDMIDVAKADCDPVPVDGSGGQFRFGWPAYGYFQELRVTVGVLSDEEIAADWALITPGGSGDETAPVVENVTPTPGGALAATRALARITPVQFDVTDLSPGVGAVIVTVKFVGDDSTLVAFDGTNFLPPFDSDTSAVTEIENGYHFSILPTAGWRKSIDELFIYAVDADGNWEALPV